MSAISCLVTPAGPSEMICSGWVNICVVVVIIVVAIITIFALVVVCFFTIRWSVSGIVGVVPGSIFLLEERAPVSVADVKAPWVTACKAMQAIDYILRKG